MRGVSHQTKNGSRNIVAIARPDREVTSALAKPSPRRTASPRILLANESGK